MGDHHPDPPVARAGLRRPSPRSPPAAEPPTGSLLFNSALISICVLLEVKLPYDPVCPSDDGRSVCYSFCTGRDILRACFYHSTWSTSNYRYRICCISDGLERKRVGASSIRGMVFYRNVMLISMLCGFLFSFEINVDVPDFLFSRLEIELLLPDVVLSPPLLRLPHTCIQSWRRHWLQFTGEALVPEREREDR